MVRRFGEEFAETLVTERYINDPVRAMIVAHAVIGMVQAAGEWWLDHPEIPYEDVIDSLTGAVVAVVTSGHAAPPAGNPVET